MLRTGGVALVDDLDRGRIDADAQRRSRPVEFREVDRCGCEGKEAAAARDDAGDHACDDHAQDRSVSVRTGHHDDPARIALDSNVKGGSGPTEPIRLPTRKFSTAVA